MTRQCCYCAYVGPEQAVRTHLALAHPDLRPPRSFGRPKGNPCSLCGFEHDEIARPGWAFRRKKFVRGKVMAAAGGVLPDGHLQTIGTFVVPPGVRKIARVEVRVSMCRGPFVGRGDPDGRRFCTSCSRPHFDARKPRPPKCWFMITREGRTIQCDLPPGHAGDHQVPPAWRGWWETGYLWDA